jgi:hypothetical protein
MKSTAAILLISLSLAACGGGQPEIALPESEVDIGSVVNGEIRNFESVVQNAGEGDLIIETVSTSCGCTTAEVTPATIPSGEQGTLTVRFDSGAHGPEETGSVTRQVFIRSNDPDQSEITFSFTADILPPPP